MPTSPPSSTDSPPPSETPSEATLPDDPAEPEATPPDDPEPEATPPDDPGEVEGEPPAEAIAWKRPLLLFVATVASVAFTGAGMGVEAGLSKLDGAVSFALPLLGILVCHELGHFLFARRHRVPASLPHFIPLPFLSPFGTMGAVIVMRGRIRSRDALLDIGASGPLAGMLVAVPVLLWGLAHSRVEPIATHGVLEGQCLLYALLKRLAVGPIAPGYDVTLGPTAFAGWAGLFLTMINLLPFGQLDGGHVAYALLGRRHDALNRHVRTATFVFALLNLALFLAVDHGYGDAGDRTSIAWSAASPWLGWWLILGLVGRASGGVHPPTDDETLSPKRRLVALGTLALFVLLFMPTPWLVH